MKKTLLVTLDFYPSIGGVAYYWESLGRWMPADSWVVLAPKLSCGVEELSTPYRTYRRNLAVAWTMPKWLPLFFHILDVIRKEHIEHIVVGQLLPVGTVVYALKLFTGISYTVSTHGMDVMLPLAHPRKKAICGRILSSAESVITISSYTQSKLVDVYGVAPEKISFVRPCPRMTPERYAPHPELEKRVNGGMIILTTARLVKRKGHELVLRALPRVFERFPDLLYAIAGDGPYRARLEAIARELGIIERVIFLGELNDAKLAWWFFHCTVFVMTPVDVKGDVEGFGMVYLEANAFGKPVIGNDSGGVRDAIVNNETGLLVQQGSVDEIANTLLLLLENKKLRNDMGERGRQRVEREFQWEEQARALQAILSKYN